jgi:predicted DNA-binding protein
MPFSEPQKLRIKQKALFQCCLCQRLPVEIHHIVPQKDGGPDDDDNAAPLCPGCHETHGGNPDRRKVIREARDHWYQLCEKRFAADSGHLGEIQRLIENVPSKADFSDAIGKLQKIITRQRPHENARVLAQSELMELSSALQDLFIARKIASVLQTRRKWQIIIAASRLSKETEKRFFALAQKAMKSEMLAFWMEELIDKAIEGKLEERLAEDFSMSEEDFAAYLERLCQRDLEAVAREEDIRLDGLTTEDAEWIQAAQAPPELYEEWSAASEEERPLLMLRWIEEGKVRRIKFAPGSEPGSETPGFYYMRRGRELLVEGKKKRGFALIRAGVVIDHTAGEAFPLWLAWGEESKGLLDDPDVVAFVTELYGQGTVEDARALRANHP